MKINPIQSPNVAKVYQTSRPVQVSKKISAGRDEATFSAEALDFSRSLSEAREAIEARTPEEIAHIASIKEAINNGEYNVDSGDVADKILASVIED